MKNKMTSFLGILSGILMGGTSACSKYPDGPGISLRSRTERVANTWKVDNYKLNGKDYTSLMTDYSETFAKEGDYHYTWGSVHGTGKWNFQNNDSEIRLNGLDNQSTYTLVILKLEEKQFWYYYMDNEDRKEFHMVSQ